MAPDDDQQLNALAAYFRTKLSGQRLTETDIEQAVDTDPFATAMDETVRTRLKRILKQSLFITQESGHLITSDIHPWLAGRKAGIDQYYWTRLRDYMIGSGELPATVVSRLDTVTDSILDCCGDPMQVGSWSSRGMVMGHVQSGKTTNYGALICKAADAGYKVIILLAGITNSLRSQTQQRMDEYFIGRKSVFNAAAQAPLEILNYSGGRHRYPDFGTSRDQDFSRNNAVTGAALSSLKEPKIFVIKKNKSVIENLNIWLHDQANGGKIDEPLLLIDDEADNASINTHKDPGQSTAINLAIKETLARFNRSTFIGYTATPFANIFIDPESVDAFAREDLFPRNFIRSLEPPTNYCGAARYFTETGDLAASVHCVGDYKDLLPLNHKKTHPVEVLPPSLEKAVRVFVLARTIRVLRGEGRKHCTMMINVSRFNDVQEKIEGKVYAYLTKLRNAIDVWSGFAEALSDPDIKALEETFIEEYADAKTDGRRLTFRDILSSLPAGAATIQVKTVNMLRKISPLNYEANKKDGLHVIAIGGLALSRGLTLDGLVVTYLLRNVGASDTLMQMARWFGYRPNYEDLCRIYLPKSGREHYEDVHLSIEELREEIGRMEIAGGTPLDFGLKVRQSETGIRITAANKMRTATKMVLAAGYAGRFIQGHAVINSDEVNRKNREVASQFLKTLGPPGTLNGTPYYWTGASGRDVVRLLEQTELPKQVQALWKLEGRRSLLSDYISDRVTAELAEWDICLATLKGSEGKGSPHADMEFLPGYTLHPVARNSGELEGSVYRFSGGKNAVADQDTPRLGLSKQEISEATSAAVSPLQNRYSLVRTRPLLVMFLVHPPRDLEGLKFTQPVFSLAVCLPLTSTAVREQTYQINRVLRDQIMQESEENSDDDEVMLTGGEQA